MKTKLALISLFVAALFVSGCATATLLNKISIGMNKGEVIAIMGTPDSTSAQSNIEYLTYYLYTDSGRGGSYSEHPYSIRLVDGKVESFGRFTQLLDVYYRPVGGQPSPLAYPGYYGAPAPQQPQAPSSSVSAEITRLNLLRQQGVMSEEEFQKAKQKLLAPDQK